MEDSFSIYNSEEMAALRVLEESRYSIENALGSGSLASPKVEEAYLLAKAQLDERISALSGIESIQNGLAEIGEHALEELNQISGLDTILDNNTFGSLRSEIVAKIDATRQHFQVYGPATPQAQNYVDKVVAAGFGTPYVAEVMQTPVPVLEEDMPGETETSKETVVRTVDVRFGDGRVRIGKNGQFVPYSRKHSAEYKDYSELRRKALVHILVNEGQELSPHQIWENISDAPYDRDSMSQVRTWLTEKAIYGRTHVVMVNGKRGLASRYVTNPALTFNLIFDQRLTAIAEDAEISETAKSIIEQKEKDPGVDLGDLFIAAERLKSFNKLLAAHGIQEISDEMTSQLSGYIPDWSEFKNNNKAIEAQRTAAIERVKSLFMSEDRLFDFLDMDSRAYDYAFIEFIADLKPAQRELVDRLFRSKKVCEDYVVRGVVLGQKYKVYDENEIEIRPEGQTSDYYYTTASQAGKTMAQKVLDIVVGPKREVKPPQIIDEPVEHPIDESSALHRQPTEPDACSEEEGPPAVTEKSRNGHFDQLVKFVDEFIEHFVTQNGRLDSGYSHSQLRHLVPAGSRSTFTRTNLIKISGDSHSARNAISSRTFEIKEIVQIALEGHQKFTPFVNRYKKELTKYVDAKVEALLASTR